MNSSDIKALLEEINFTSVEFPGKVKHLAKFEMAITGDLAEHGPTMHAMRLFSRLASSGYETLSDALATLDGDAVGSVQPSALPPPNRKDRATKAAAGQANGKIKRTQDPRTMDDWRREFFQWAADHSGELNMAEYRVNKFAKDYPDVAFSNTRASQTISYMAGGQKTMHGDGKGGYKLTAKGRKAAADMGITVSVATPPTPSTQEPIILPPGYKPDGQVGRMVKLAQEHDGVLDMSQFSRDERHRSGSTPGAPRLSNTALNSGLFVKIDATHLKLKPPAAKSAAASA